MNFKRNVDVSIWGGAPAYDTYKTQYNILGMFGFSSRLYLKSKVQTTPKNTDWLHVHVGYILKGSIIFHKNWNKT